MILCITVWQNMTCVLGNDNLHALTSDKRQRLRVEMADYDNDTAFAVYDNFVIGSEDEKYKLESIGRYSGNAGKYALFIGEIVKSADLT